MLSASNQSKEESNFSILDDTIKILSALKEKAYGALGKKDSEMTTYGSSDEDEKNYQLTHKARLTLEESNLSKERFYATYILLENAINSICEKSNNYKNALEIHLNQGTDDIRLDAKYPHQVKQKAYFEEKGKYLAAPITQVPFDEIEHSLKNNLTEAFSNWNIHENNAIKLIRKFQNTSDKYKLLGQLFAIRNSCKEIDEKNDFNIETSYDSKLATLSWIKVNSSKFEAAKLLTISNNELKPHYHPK